MKHGPMTELTVPPHPMLQLEAFEVPIGGLAATSPDWLVALLSAGASAPVSPSEEVRQAVRSLLRHGGYKPTGRGKPASEYLQRAAGEGTLSSIQPVVDAGNAVSLHSGLPISVVDLDRARGPLSVSIAAEGSRYVFNAAGQEIDVSGLLCLHDADGPCANAVKDAQRTKLHAATVRTLWLIWGPRSEAAQVRAARAFAEEVLGRLGTEPLPCTVREG